MDRTQRNLAIFSVVAVGCGWVGVGMDALLGIPSDTPSGSPGLLIFIVTPMLTGLALRGLGNDGWNNTGFRLRLRGNLGWYTLSILVFPVVTAINVAIGIAAGGLSAPNFQLPAYLTVVAAAILPQLIKNFFEEAAWRSYLTGRLLDRTRNDAALYLCIGTIWALWHAPYYLFFLPDEIIASVSSLSRWGWVLLSVPYITTWTVMFTEIYRAAQSIWPLVLAHAAKDVFMVPLLTQGFVNVSPQWEFAFSPLVGLAPNVLLLAVGLFLRQRRLRAERVRKP